MNGKTAELYDILVQEGVDLALSKEECETSEGLVHLLEDTEQTLAAVEKMPVSYEVVNSFDSLMQIVGMK